MAALVLWGGGLRGRSWGAGGALEGSEPVSWGGRSRGGWRGDPCPSFLAVLF